MEEKELLEIPGDYLEGGGQILRTALSLSVITRRPIRVFNIRAKRPKPGLKPQHLHTLKALAQISKAKISGVEIGSREITFRPSSDIGKSSLNIDVGTAGAIGLILQPLLLVGALASKGLTLLIKGGTSGKGAVPVEYYPNVLFPILKGIGLIADLKIKRCGYYPKGGGEISVNIKPLGGGGNLELIEQGRLIKITGISLASNLLKSKDIATRQSRTAEELLAKSLPCPIQIESKYVDTFSLGSEINLYAHTDSGAILGVDSRGERGKPAEEVGREAVVKLIKEVQSGAAVDRHLADNLIPWLALLGGKIKTSEITLHTRTNIWVCESFFGRIFRVEGNTIVAQPGVDRA